MDAKPQRPARSVRIRGDENQPPNLPANKTLHQRNKSTPVLSSMSGVTGLKAAAKRTAFVDVSNTSNAVRSSKDDSAVSIKVVDENVGKEQQTNKKAAPLLRPAQRPGSMSSSLKGILGNITNTATAEPANAAQPSNSRKVVTKQKTTIFKDPTLPSVSELPVSLPAENLNHIIAPSRPTHGLAVASPLWEHPLEVQTLIETRPLSKINLVRHRSSTTRSDGVSIDNNGNIHIYRDDPSPSEEAVVPVVPSESKEETPARPALVDLPPPLNKSDAQEVVSDHQPSHPAVAQPSEPEEYWDDEEDENYDEEGYVTARSYRSMGGNTTTGATTVLFPVMSQKIEREIAAARDIVEGSRTVEEIEDDCWDTSMVAEYGDEIFQYMRDLEIRMLPNAHYMEKQSEIQWSMRSLLMDWLVQVHHRFSLLPETLFLCVNYIDRFLSCKIVSLGKLQLVGATAIFIAAKYEEINCPSVQEIVYMVDGGYTIDEILKAERFMLSMLQFELGWPGPMSFLRRISKADDYDLETRTLAKYFLEVTIMDERFVGSPPSYVAAGAHCLARFMLNKGDWTPAHVYYSNYTYGQLRPIVTLILECCENPQKHHAAVFDKYCDKRYKKASLYAQSNVSSTLQYLQLERQVSFPRCS